MRQISAKHYPVCVLAILAALLFLCPANVIAIPIAEYEQDLKNAIAALEALIQHDEGEGTSDYESRFNQTVEAIRAGLAANQTVEVEEEVHNVDNSWLHKNLDELKPLTVDDRAEKISRVIETLQAIEARIIERQNHGRAIDSKDQAKSRLESILARPEYATGAKGPNALTRLLQDFMNWLRKALPKPAPVEPGRASSISWIAQIVVIFAAILVIVYVVKILLARFKRSGRFKSPKKRKARIVLGERLEPEATATDLLFEAEALARSGDLRAAIRKAYIALLVELGDRKLISLAQHKTNRDYLNSVKGVPQLHSRMRGLTDSFERHWYGFAQATQNDWQDFRAGYLAALQTGN